MEEPMRRRELKKNGRTKEKRKLQNEWKNHEEKSRIQKEWKNQREEQRTKLQVTVLFL
jgi:hypothetical protein